MSEYAKNNDIKGKESINLQGLTATGNTPRGSNKYPSKFIF